jgi:hypothetical protein
MQLAVALALTLLVPLVPLVAACDDGASAEESAPDPPRAAEFRSEQVRTVIEAAEQTIRTRGFASDGEEQRGFLVAQGSAVHEAPLRAGSCYVILGAGSEALRELDLRIFDSDGTEVAQDAQRGAGAALFYCPPHAGTHYVAALATAGTGLYAVRRYAGPTGLEVRLDDLFREVSPAAPSSETNLPERL